MKIEDPKNVRTNLKNKSNRLYSNTRNLYGKEKWKNSDKATILNNYFNECFKASKHEKVNNICNITYDLK